jgi:hypothetical protein
MAAAGTVKVVVSCDARPALDSLGHIADKLNVACASTAYERAAALERMYNRQMAGAADVFAASRTSRRRLDPRRVSDRMHERACRGWIAKSEAARRA